MLTERRTIGPYIIYERRPKPRGLTKYVVGKEGKADLKDFGKFSTAVRWVKQQIPRPAPHLIIDYDDKSGVSTMPVTFTILDGEHVHTAAAVVDPERVESILGIPK